LVGYESIEPIEILLHLTTGADRNCRSIWVAKGLGLTGVATGLAGVALGFAGLAGVVLGFAGLAGVVLGFAGLAGVVLGFAGLAGVALGFAGLAGFALGLGNGRRRHLKTMGGHLG
jgi:hypothetical protein